MIVAIKMVKVLSMTLHAKQNAGDPHIRLSWVTHRVVSNVV